MRPHVGTRNPEIHPLGRRGRHGGRDGHHIGRPFLAWMEYFSGRLSEAAATSECLISDAGDHVPSIANNIVRSAFPIAVDTGRWDDARRYAEMLERHCDGQVAWRGWIGAMRDIALIRAHRSPQALDRFADFVTGGEPFTGFRRQSWYHMRLVKACLILGRRKQAATFLSELIEFVESREDNWWRPEMITLQGHLFAGSDGRAAFARYQDAIEIAAAEGSTLLELRASLGAERVAIGHEDRLRARRQSREAMLRLVDRSPSAGAPANLRLLRHSLCVCRTVQQRLRSDARMPIAAVA